MSSRPAFRVGIDVSKIDKAHLSHSDKGVYLNLTIWEKDEPGKYGDTHFITQDISREAREAGARGAILGNMKPCGSGSRGGGGGGRGGSRTAAPDFGGDRGRRQERNDDDNIPF